MRRLSLALLLIACAHGAGETKGDGPPLADYYPLAVGNSWTYDIKMLGAPEEQRTVTVTGQENGMYKDSSGSLLTIDAYGIRDDKRYLLRLPLEVGTKWNNVVSVSSFEQYSIVEAGQDCVCPAGTFHQCIVVEGRNKIEGDKTLIVTWTFAPKVGIVALSTDLEAEGKHIPQTKLGLAKFDVKPAAPAPAPAH